MKSTLIVGAGLAGLLAAQSLQDAGIQVTVVDKGRGVGGRLATRRLTDNQGNTIGRFDHGAQYFTARDPRFQALVQEWLATGVLEVWTEGFNTPAGPKADGMPRYRGREGMTSLPKHLALDLNVQTNVQINAIWPADAGWRATTAAGDSFFADAILLTPPAEQTLALLDAGAVPLSEAARKALTTIQFDPCFAALVTLDGPSTIPPPGGLWPNDGVISWIADNQQKGISGAATVTIHASPAFTRQHYDDDRELVGQKLIDAAQAWLGANAVSCQVHRWRYSIPTVIHPEPYLVLNESPMALVAGDAFAGPRVEGAALSGLAAADRLLGR